MNEKLNIHGFDIDTNKIPKNVIEEKCNLLSEKRKVIWRKNFGSEYNYLVLLFHFKFIEKLENSHIHETLGYKNAANIQHLLYDLGWHYSFDYEENQRLFQNELRELNNFLEEAKQKSVQLDKNALEHKKLKLALEKVHKLKKDSYINLGFKTGEEYARTIYYLTHVHRQGQGLSPKELIHLFNYPSVHMAQTHLRDLGLNKSRVKGIEGKKQRESQNYEKTYHAGQITRRRTQIEYYSGKISIPEEYFRRHISDVIYKYLDSERFEIVVGINNTVGLEIDIPIVVYNPKQKQIFRFAIEYNAPNVHTLESDLKKQRLLEGKGWIYKKIIGRSEHSNDQSSLNREIDETCANIKNIVDANYKPLKE